MPANHSETHAVPRIRIQRDRPDVPVAVMAKQLELAARSAPSGVFDVGEKEIAKKIDDAERVAYSVEEGRRVLAFMSVRSRIELRRCGLRMAYVEGVIVHNELRRRDMPLKLLMCAEGRDWMPDVIALHTQTPGMARNIERWGDACFPRSTPLSRMSEALRADLRESMALLPHPREIGDLTTGVCRNEYPRRLFLGNLIEGLGDQDALFMVSLASEAALARGLACR